MKRYVVQVLNIEHGTWGPSAVVLLSDGTLWQTYRNRGADHQVYQKWEEIHLGTPPEAA